MKMHYLEMGVQELRALRAVVVEIESVNRQFPGTVPDAIMKKYNVVKDLYAEQLDNEEYLTTTVRPNVFEEIY